MVGLVARWDGRKREKAGRKKKGKGKGLRFLPSYRRSRPPLAAYSLPRGWGGKLYAVGGQDAGYNALSSVERYDAATNAWEAVAPMAEVRHSHAMAVLDGKLYALGGIYLSSVERYDPAVDAWEAVAPMATARDSLATAVLDGKLYAVGGWNDDGGLLSSMERYDPATNAWEAVAPMAEAREAHAVAALDGKLYAVGGYCVGVYGGASSCSLERYDPATYAWEAAAPLTTARLFHAITVA